MFGKNKFSAFPELGIDKKRNRFGLSNNTILLIVSVILLFPSAWFWSSVVLRLGLGTDYFFDVFFDKLGETKLGNFGLIAAIIFLPGLAIGINGMAYVQRKAPTAISTMVIGGLFLAAGFFAAINRG